MVQLKKYPWSKIFAHICWALWTSRCSRAMEGVNRTEEDIYIDADIG